MNCWYLFTVASRYRLTVKRSLKVPATLLLLLLSYAGASLNASAASEARSVLAIANPSQFGYATTDIPLRTRVETPLNHIGLKLHHHDWARNGSPAAAQVAASRGAIVWFDGDRLKDADQFLGWAIEYMRSGRYLVLAGSQAYLRTANGAPANPQLVQLFYKTLGYSFDPVALDSYEKFTVTQYDTDLIGWESEPELNLPHIPQVRSLEKNASVYLQIQDRHGARSDVVSKSSTGGVLLGEFSYTSHMFNKKGRWIINPMRYFAEVLRVTDHPVPDISTLNGKRIYFSHVDGDGWNSISAVPAADGNQKINAALMYERLIAPYPDLPVTVGPISADLDTRLQGTKHSQQVARAIFAEPQVELASHTHTHPFEWQYFSSGAYDARVEKEVMGGRSTKKSKLRELVGGLLDFSSKESLDGEYRNETYEIPRAYFDGPFDLQQEIEKSAALIGQFAPAGKEVEVILWSGNCSPSGAFIEHTRKQGFTNLNGGITRYDAEFPSLIHVAPLTRVADGQVQINSAMPNEIIYTDGWTERFHAFKLLKQTIDNTGSPIRFRPINLYYHTFIADKQQGIDSVVGLLDYVRTLDLSPIPASGYSRIVEGWDSAEITAHKGYWNIRNRGELQTMRFDRPAKRSVDYQRSRGVIGHQLFQGSLYVFLDPASADVDIALTKRQRKSTAYLDASRWPVLGAKLSRSTADFTVAGFGAGELSVQFPQACAGTASVSSSSGNARQWDISSDATGKVTLELEQSPALPTNISIACAAAGA